MRRELPGIAVCALGLLVLGVAVFRHLSYPLLWQDEGETVMFAERVVAHGYPKVHGARNVVNEFGAHAAAGAKEGPDAYIGKPWADFYFAVPGLLWAARSDDPRLRTFRLRLPFALAGVAGIGVWVWALWPAFGGRRRGLVLAGAFLLLCASSASLVHHVREVRYYPLLLLLLGGVLGLHLRRSLGFAARGQGVALALLLAALFHVFYPAWAVCTVVLGGERAVAAWRGPVSGRGRRLAGELLPFAIAALLVAPCLVFFETLTVASSFAGAQGVGPGRWLENLAAVGAYLLLHELGAAALVARILVLIDHRARPGRRADSALGARCTGLLLRFGVGYVALVCVNPLVYERYFFVLGPLVSAIFLLDASTLARALPRRAAPGTRRLARAGVAGAMGLLVAGSLAMRAPELLGRIAELREPVRGPLDFLVPHLLDRYDDPEALVIATSYEAHPLMYYLGSRVIVGLTLHNIERERALEPDVVVVRRGWPRGVRELRGFLARGRYREERLPVRDVHFNQIASASRWPATPDRHRYRTPAVSAEDPAALQVFHRETGPPAAPVAH